MSGTTSNSQWPWTVGRGRCNSARSEIGEYRENGAKQGRGGQDASLVGTACEPHAVGRNETNEAKAT